MIERIEINLLPAEYRVHRRKIRLQREVVYPVLGLIILAFGLLIFTVTKQSEMNILSRELDLVTQQINQNRPIQDTINQLRKDKLATQEKNRALERINVNREKWVRLMEELSSRLPSYTWLVSVKEDNGIPPSLYIEGRTFSFPEVANYMSNLKESIYVTGVDLSNIEQIDSKTKTYKFSISCTINPDANMNPVSPNETQAPVKGGM